MERGKRASMREGPLAALFRKTEDEGLEEPLRKEEEPSNEQRATTLRSRPRPRAELRLLP